MNKTTQTLFLLLFSSLLHAQQGGDNSRWVQRERFSRTGFPEVSAWHSGTAGIIRSNAAELNLTSPSRIGFSGETELQLRIGEEFVMPNIGLRHRWWHNERFHLTTEHSLHYTWPLLKIIQSTGLKDLIPDSVKIGQGIAMRNEVQFSWLLNPQVAGCPDPVPEMILTARVGTEFYMGDGKNEVAPFDWLHSLYHTQILDGKILWYGGIQFDSYFLHRFHYSLNALYYSIDLKKDYALEGNARLTYFVSSRIGVSASCRASCMRIAEALPGENGISYARNTKLRFLPLLDLTYLINPGRGTIEHGLSGKKRKNR